MVPLRDRSICRSPKLAVEIDGSGFVITIGLLEVLSAFVISGFHTSILSPIDISSNAINSPFE
jgi:hypothetical protein